MKRMSWANLRGHALIVASLAALGGFGVLAAMHGGAPPLDADGCRIGAPLRAHTVLVVDTSNPLVDSPGDARAGALQQVALSRVTGIERSSKLSVMQLDGRSGRAVSVLFSRCSPGQGHEFSAVDDNPRMRQARFDREFLDPLTRTLEALARSPAAHTSPLLEAFEYIALRADFSADVAERKLVVVSDFVQNSSRLNQYLHAEDRAGPSRGLSRRFDGVEVELYYVRRVALYRVQSPDHERFWQELFTRKGADVTLRYW
jgi:hypothetical protein